MKRKYVKDKKCIVCGKRMLKPISFAPSNLISGEELTSIEAELRCMNKKCKAMTTICIYKDRQNEKIFKPIMVNFAEDWGI